jgi:hypothetical protein
VATTASNSLVNELMDRDPTFEDDAGEDPTYEFSRPFFEKGELLDFGSDRTFLLRGDLVELRYNSLDQSTI